MSDNLSPGNLSPGQMLRHWFQTVWNEGKPELIDAWVAPDAPVQGMDGGRETIAGPAAFRAAYDGLRAAFADIRFEVQDVMETTDQAIGRWEFTATHAGEFKGARATGNRVTITGMTIIRVADGKFVAGWNEWDRLTLALATGAVVPRQGG
jgi:predicted ester cyclase